MSCSGTPRISSSIVGAWCCSAFGGGVGESSSSSVAGVTSVTKYTEKLCGKEYENDMQNKVWFSNPTSSLEEIELPTPILHSFLTNQKSTACYYAVKPFEYVPERNVWEIVVYYANPKRIYGIKAMESFIDKETLDGAKILETIIYNPDGSIAAKYNNYNDAGYPE